MCSACQLRGFSAKGQTQGERRGREERERGEREREEGERRERREWGGTERERPLFISHKVTKSLKVDTAGMAATTTTTTTAAAATVAAAAAEWTHARFLRNLLMEVSDKKSPIFFQRSGEEKVESHLISPFSAATVEAILSPLKQSW